MTVCTDHFLRLGEAQRRTLGMTELPLAATPHPLGGLKPDQVRARAEALLEQVVAALTA